MGFRFRKSFKIAPGVKVNVGKKSVGVSVGTKGFRKSINSSGRRTTTVGIPGTGISYTTSSSSKSSNRKKKTTHSTQPVQSVQSAPTSGKSKEIALVLCVLLGYLGIHHFYVGKTGMGILYLFTGGIFGIGWIIDIIAIATGSFRDNAGAPLIASQKTTNQGVNIPQAQTNANIDVADQLKKLAELRDTGILTEEEFNEQKTKLLS